jgi:hypothetical protein
VEIVVVVTAVRRVPRKRPTHPGAELGELGIWSARDRNERGVPDVELADVADAIGSRRRAALSRSRARVSSFSVASNSRRAANHSSRDTTSGKSFIIVTLSRSSRRGALAHLDAGWSRRCA